MHNQATQGTSPECSSLTDRHSKADCIYLKGTQNSLRIHTLLSNRFRVLTGLGSVILLYQVPYFNIKLFTFTPA